MAGVHGNIAQLDTWNNECQPTSFLTKIFNLKDLPLQRIRPELHRHH